MTIPELISLTSPDLEEGQYPEDPADCAVLLEAEIGPSDEDGADLFNFVVVTHRFLAREAEPRWVRGQLVVPEFSWKAARDSLSKLLLSCSGNTWSEVSEKLSRYLHWEYEDYQG